MMTPVCDPSRVTRPADPVMVRIARALDNRRYVRELLAERQPDFARELRLAQQLIRTHRCEHANHS
jgi:hypothetical protein